MGVDSRLEIPITIRPEFIVYSVAKAAGEDVPHDSTGQENVFRANSFWHQYNDSPISPFDFFPLRGEAGKLGARFNLHLTYLENEEDDFVYRCAEAPCWMLMGRATKENIAILRTVAEVWGGRLEYRDSDEHTESFEGKVNTDRPEGDPSQRWNYLCALAYSTPVATVTEFDIAQAAYS